MLSPGRYIAHSGALWFRVVFPATLKQEGCGLRILILGMSALRTLPPFALAAIAHAAFPRTCSGIFSVVQRISPNRTSNGVNSDKFQIAFSLRSVSTIETRTNRTCACAANAHAEIHRMRSVACLPNQGR